MASVKDKLIVPIEIPVWAAICLIGSGLFTAGVLNNKMDMLVEQSKKIDLVYERQIANIQDVKYLKEDMAHLKDTATDLKIRVSKLESKKE